MTLFDTTYSNAQNLPATGFATSWLLIIGGLILLAGCVGVLWSDRR